MTDQREGVRTMTGLADANLFEISGPIVISYATSQLHRRAAAFLRRRRADAQLLRDWGFTRTEVLGGELVTVTIEEVIDAFVRTFTVLVPRITVSRGEQIEFDALGIETIDRSRAFVPAPGPAGVLQTYQVHDLRGVAQAVAF